MKNNGTTTILNWALMLGAVAVIVSGFNYYNSTRTLRNYQVLVSQASVMQNTENVMRSLLNDSLEYAKTNPAINPVLDSIINRQAAKPATNPAPAKR